MSRFGILLNVGILCGFFTEISEGLRGGKTTCGTNQWQCLDSTCIFLIGRCDNYPDCTDSSDERGCNFDVCSEGHRKCSSGECIDGHKFCNGVVDCLDASDELAADCQAKNSIPTVSKVSITEMNTTQRITTPPSATLAPLPPWVPFHVDSEPVPIPMPTVVSNADTPTDNNNQVKETPVTTLYNVPSFPRSDSNLLPAAPVDQHSPTTSKTPCVSNDEIYEFCHRRYRGYFKHPTDCSMYIVCEWGFMHVCRCPEETHWSVQFTTCVWDYTEPCDNGPVPPIVRFVQRTSKATTVATTPTNNAITTEPYMVFPQFGVRAQFPVTPAWLKKLSEKSNLMNIDKQTPQYKSLLTRFFKAVPLEDVKPGMQ